MGGDAGSVLLAKQLDWETQQEYNLTISVTDGVNTVFTQVSSLHSSFKNIQGSSQLRLKYILSWVVTGMFW